MDTHYDKYLKYKQKYLKKKYGVQYGGDLTEEIKKSFEKIYNHDPELKKN